MSQSIRRRHRWGVRLLRYSLFLISFACLGDYFYTTVDREIHQSNEEQSFERQQMAPEGTVKKRGPVPPQATPAARVSHRPTHDSGMALARLSVPRLGIRAMVDEGIDDGTLSHSVGHFPGTAFPGDAGNVAIAGHRDTFFRDLRRVRKQDEIDLETRRGEFRYRVESIVVVDPLNTSVIAPTPQNTLTLVTCYPFEYIGSAPRRFVVRARQIGRPETSP